MGLDDKKRDLFRSLGNASRVQRLLTYRLSQPCVTSFGVSESGIACVANGRICCFAAIPVVRLSPECSRC